MTVATTTSSQTFSGNGATTVFSFDFVFFDDSTITAYFTNGFGITTLIPQGDYTLAGEGKPGGGSITYPLTGPPIANGTVLTVYRNVPYQQLVTIKNQGAFYAAVTEQGLDMLELQIQQLYALIQASTGFVSRATVQKTANFSSDNTIGSILCNALSGGFTITLPAIGSMFIISDTFIPAVKITKIDSTYNPVVVSGDAQILYGGDALSSLTLSTPGQSVEFDPYFGTWTAT